MRHREPTIEWALGELESVAVTEAQKLALKCVHTFVENHLYCDDD